jgi:mannose-6-phosphate isomerase-like protein (cupin superfamily)
VHGDQPGSLLVLRASGQWNGSGLAGAAARRLQHDPPGCDAGQRAGHGVEQPPEADRDAPPEPVPFGHLATGYVRRVADVTHVKIDEIDAIEGFFEGIVFHRAAAGLGVRAFGVSIIDLAPGADEYPEHDHSEDGLGGQMFSERPQQLGQEEVYVALRGSGTLEADGRQFPIDQDHIARIGPDVKRKIVPGPDGIRLLALGGIPGQAYESSSL